MIYQALVAGVGHQMRILKKRSHVCWMLSNMTKESQLIKSPWEVTSFVILTSR